MKSYEILLFVLIIASIRYYIYSASSHRAMIPTILTPRVTFRDQEMEEAAERTYVFNVLTGTKFY